MASKDTIADMLTRIRNANLARQQTVEIPATRMTRSIAQVLKYEGFISDFLETKLDERSQLVITLKYKGKTRQPAARNLTRNSKLSSRLLSNHQDLNLLINTIKTRAPGYLSEVGSHKENETEEKVLKRQIEAILEQQAIVNILYKSKYRQFVNLLIMAGLSFASVVLSMKFGILPVEPKLIALFAGLTLLPSSIIWLRNKAIKYRILKGYYGNSRDEARELIAFIESMANDIPPPSSGGDSMKTFPDGVIESDTPIDVEGLVGEGT